VADYATRAKIRVLMDKMSMQTSKRPLSNCDDETKGPVTVFAGKSFLSFIKLADRDGSGKVSREEFLDALHRCARTPHV
jgi:hypothetical protein